MEILRLIEITKRFGGLEAVNRVSLDIREGEILGLIGPNGAGKTTLFNLVSGHITPETGAIEFQGNKINGLKPFQICRLGIGRTFQIVKPFGEATVLENVIIGGLNRVSSILEARKIAQKELEFVDLQSKAYTYAHNLPVGDRKRLEVARALATQPQMLLLDEPIGGLNPSETESLVEIIRKIQTRGVTIFLIEHVMSAVMKLSERIVVLNYGKIIAEGTPAQISKNKEVIAAYLGEEYALP
ncbi:MAG: ABC transporter ATP-binding protein [Thermodesulfobacteriota bacterium]